MGDMEMIKTAVGIAVGMLFGAFFLVWLVKQFMFIARPNELLVFAGRSNTLKDGSKVGYRVINPGSGKGRAFRWPVLETVERMDLSTIEVEVVCKNGYCRGGIRINVSAIANVKVSPDLRIQRNAIERFLGQGRSEIQDVAKNTLEGHLRAVLATLTPEEVNEDRLKFSEKLKHEAELDLNKLGIHLDTFNVHSVGDVRDSSYLAEIGRKSLAEVIKNAEINEATCERAATEAEAEAHGQAGVAKEQAETAIRVAQNELLKAKADFEARAKSTEEQAEAARDTARAVAELELQKVRAQLEGRRLQAEVVVRAEAESEAKSFAARGAAAPIAERGHAMASSLELMRTAWADAGDGAKPIFMIQQVDQILREVVSRVRKIKVDSVSLIDQGDGSALPAYVSSFPATVNRILGELDQVTGIDIVGTLGSDLPNGNGSRKVGA
jgi:flotillin